MIFSRGERVRVTAPDHPLFKHEGFTTANGSFLRERNGKLRVQIDGTAEMGTEGDVWGDFEYDQVERIPQSGAQ